jgi:aryl-alcohol dehydrogenase-like predicted oxidoreductase
VHPICDLQIEYSLISRGIEPAILPTCRELGVAITAYGVLSRGLISGRYRADRAADAGDIRGRMPRFQGENLAHNLALVERLRGIAEANDATVAQIAFAWVLSRGEDIVPLIGARRRDQLEEALGAREIELTNEDLAQIEQVIPVDAAAGGRYGAPQMADLDSER